MTRRSLVAATIVALTIVIAIGGDVAMHRRRPADATPIGGAWFVTPLKSYYGAGHTSPSMQSLYRMHGAWYTEVTTSAVRVRFYEPDCVVFQTILPIGMIWAACGDRSPVAILRAASDWVFKFEPEGLVDYDVGAVFVKPIDRVLALAQRQPPYRRDWARPYSESSQVNPIEDVERPYQPGDSARPPR